jgi:hypothetical protein
MKEQTWQDREINKCKEVLKGKLGANERFAMNFYLELLSQDKTSSGNSPDHHHENHQKRRRKEHPPVKVKTVETKEKPGRKTIPPSSSKFRKRESNKWTSEIFSFIKDNLELSNPELIKEIKRKFNMKVTYSALCSQMSIQRISRKNTEFKKTYNARSPALRRKQYDAIVEKNNKPKPEKPIKVEKDKKQSKYTPEIIEFMRENSELPNAEIISKVKEKFDFEIPSQSMGYIKNRYGIKGPGRGNGRTKKDFEKTEKTDDREEEIVDFIRHTRNSPETRNKIIQRIQSELGVSMNAERFEQICKKYDIKRKNQDKEEDEEIDFAEEEI